MMSSTIKGERSVSLAEPLDFDGILSLNLPDFNQIEMIRVDAETFDSILSSKAGDICGFPTIFVQILSTRINVWPTPDAEYKVVVFRGPAYWLHYVRKRNLTVDDVIMNHSPTEARKILDAEILHKWPL